MHNKDLNILHNFNILYLEDDENLLKHTRDILEDFVNNIYAVKTISEALDILLNKKVDVIISDILLKDENGIDFLKHIKGQISCKNIEIIINNQKYDGTSFLVKIPINKEIIEEKKEKDE